MPDFLLEIGTEEIPARMIRERMRRNYRSASRNLLARIVVQASASKRSTASRNRLFPHAALACTDVRHSGHST